jgi:1,4-dihydroxy-2-naphthoate octaprenyltransferase
MPIDLSAVDWAYVGVLSLLAFVAALLGSIISFRNKFFGAILAGLLFGVGFIFWTYYPHDNIPGPTSLTPPSTSPATPK